MTVSAVIFDIGNVLLEWQPERHFDRIVGKQRREELFASVDLNRMNELVDLGHDFGDTIEAWASAHPAWSDEIRMWQRDWLKMASPAIEPSVGLLRALRAKSVPVFALSNFGIATFEIAQAAYPFLTEFDRFYISGQMGVIKPDPEIYRRVEADCGLAPGSLLFADDRSDNITAAAARGWKTHHFDGASGWADRLVAEGLLSVQDIAP